MCAKKAIFAVPINERFLTHSTIISINIYLNMYINVSC